MSLSNGLEQSLLKQLLRGGEPLQPTQWVLALFSDEVGDGGFGTELVGGGYQRMAVSFADPEDADDGSSRCVNAHDIISASEATADWPPVTHAAVYLGDSDHFVWAALASPVQILAGQYFYVKAGRLSVGLN